MCSQALKILFLAVAVVGLGFSASASEEVKEGDKKESKPEIKREEDWNVVQARVSGLETKVKAGQEEINKLILEKNQTKDSARSQEIIEQLVQLHKQLKENVKEYDQQRALLKYRYPERGLKDERVYERIDVKSLPEMESQMNLSHMVTRTMNKVRSQYETPEERKARLEKKENSEKTQSRPPAANLIDPVILKK